MCIIAIKELKAEFPSLSRVKAMCDNNPHGFALAYANRKGRGVSIFKTMDKKAFLDKYKEIVEAEDKDDTSMFIHARISTHGTISLKNCHGWKDDEVGLCFAHNGILDVHNREDMTDSETFFRDIFVPVFKAGGWEAAEKAVDAIIGSSKFVFMDTKGTLKYYGQYIPEDDGCLYSNYTYVDVSDYYDYGGKKVYKKKEEEEEERELDEVEIEGKLYELWHNYYNMDIMDIIDYMQPLDAFSYYDKYIYKTEDGECRACYKSDTNNNWAI